MGRPTGPVPKRSDQRRRQNKPEVPIEKAPAARHVEVPVPDERWHPLARDWFVSLGESGQSVFYEPSDWQTARYVAEAMSRNLADSRFSAMLFASVMSATTSLLVTEGDRRRLRIELERASVSDPDEEAAVVELDGWQRKLSG